VASKSKNGGGGGAGVGRVRINHSGALSVGGVVSPGLSTGAGSTGPLPVLPLP
jgi:hypothetical protein